MRQARRDRLAGLGKAFGRRIRQESLGAWTAVVAGVAALLLQSYRSRLAVANREMMAPHEVARYDEPKRRDRHADHGPEAVKE